MNSQVLRFLNFRSNTFLASVCRSGLGDVQKDKLDLSQVLARPISTKIDRERENIPKPKPWPYETKKYTWFRSLYDSTKKRFDENTKIVVVEGNIASGKSSLAKTLAEELDMHFMPEVSMDQLYILPDGFDFRKLDHLLPKNFKCCDIRTFYENPHHQQVPFFQMQMYRLRMEQYLDALAHLLNTGQGVVLERCIYSDFVFMETLCKFGYVPKRVKKYYYDCLRNVMFELKRPHLVLYLDVPSEILLQRIKERNIPYEVNSKVLTKDYLDTIEYFYKHVYLKNISTHAELLVYDWSSYGDPEVVVEDIERLDFEKYGVHDLKMKDWQRLDGLDWNNLRRKFTNDKVTLMTQADIPGFSVPEILASGEESEEYMEIVNKYCPQLKYLKDYNPFSKESSLFKTKMNYREMQKFKLPIYSEY